MDSHIYQAMAEVEERHWWFVGRRAIVSEFIRRRVPGGRLGILDVGCGTGGNLEMLSEFGAVTGLELDAAAVHVASSKRVAPVIRAAMPGLPFKKSSFQLIVALDVLEHLDDDMAALAALVEVLEPQGLVIATVPAFSFLWGEHDVVHHHRRRYTVSQLERLFTRAGLTVEYGTYFNVFWFPLIALVRVLRRYLPLGTPAHDLKPPAPLVNRCLRHMFALERFAIGRTRCAFGVSALVCGRKKTS